MSIPTMTAELFAGQVGRGFTERNLLHRLKALDLAVVCDRCGGSGRYSFNLLTGDRCFKCDGNGALLPPLTMKKADKVRLAVDGGGLDAYHARIKAKQEVKRLMEGIIDFFNGLPLCSMWRQIHTKHHYSKIHAEADRKTSVCYVNLSIIRDIQLRLDHDLRLSDKSKTLTVAEKVELIKKAEARAAELSDEAMAHADDEKLGWLAKYC